MANGGRALFLRDVASVTMDLDDVERIEFRALGGSDNIAVADLTGTDVTRVDLDLRGPAGGGDGATDAVTVNGTNGGDTVLVVGDAGGVAVTGLASTVNIFHFDGVDRLTVNGQGGDDVINAISLQASGIKLTLNGGLGDDVFFGGPGGELFNGGDGGDVALMGAGDDTFVWNPGDDSDVLEGQSGLDTMLFNGANIAENIDISANGGRVVFFRNVANVVMDLNDTEVIEFNALGGADTITVNNLAGTDVTEVRINLAGAGGGGDGQVDTVVVNGSNSFDIVDIRLVGGALIVQGLTARIVVSGFELGTDRLRLDGLGGNDQVDARQLNFAGTLLTIDGGAGNDLLMGSPGHDVLLGGTGDDGLFGYDGDDLLDGGDGTDALFGGAGNNQLLNGEVGFIGIGGGALAGGGLVFGG